MYMYAVSVHFVENDIIKEETVIVLGDTYASAVSKVENYYGADLEEISSIIRLGGDEIVRLGEDCDCTFDVAL